MIFNSCDKLNFWFASPNQDRHICWLPLPSVRRCRTQTRCHGSPHVASSMHRSISVVEHLVPSYNERAENVSGSHPQLLGRGVGRVKHMTIRKVTENRGQWQKNDMKMTHEHQMNWFAGEANVKTYQIGSDAKSSNFEQHSIYVYVTKLQPSLANMCVMHGCRCINEYLMTMESGSNTFLTWTSPFPVLLHVAVYRIPFNPMSRSNSYLFAPSLHPNRAIFVPRVMGLWPVDVWLIHHVVGLLRLVHLSRT